MHLYMKVFVVEKNVSEEGPKRHSKPTRRFWLCPFCQTKKKTRKGTIYKHLRNKLLRSSAQALWTTLDVQFLRSNILPFLVDAYNHVHSLFFATVALKRRLRTQQKGLFTKTGDLEGKSKCPQFTFLFLVFPSTAFLVATWENRTTILLALG